ncbi:MAG: putative lipid II flippase FtsW [Firmicutes bacterium]|nr:putative lipid II flippase FtsW [Bacillota bacterium]
MLAIELKKTKKTSKKTKPIKTKKQINYLAFYTRLEKYKPKYLSLSLLIAVVGISVFGVLMVYSASFYVAAENFNNRFYFFNRQFLGFCLAIVALVICYFIDYKILQRLTIPSVVVATIALVAVFIPGIGVEQLGAKRWIGFGLFTIQASDIAKFCFVIFCAGFLAKNNFRLNSFLGLIPILFVGGGFCLLIILEPNMSITVCLALIMVLILFLGGAKLKHLLILAAPLIALIPIFIILEPYRMSRLVAFLDPWANPKDEGFQLIQSLYALGSGGWFGVGYLQSRQKYLFLPFSESDFIFSIIGEEFGFIGASVVILIFCYVIFKCFSIGLKCQDRFGTYLCLGVGCVIMIQTFVNLAVVTGSIPPTGLPLPFISFGGTSLLVFMAAIGIVLNVEKNNRKNTNLKTVT